MIVRIAIKVKMKVLLSGPLPVVVCLVSTILKRILVRVLMLLRIKVLIVLPMITLRWRRRL
jgi:hypothetical protein